MKKPHRLIVLLLASALNLPATAAEPTGAAGAADKLMAEGHAAFATKDYAKAQAAYAQVGALTNATAAHQSIAQLRLAQTCWRAGDLPAAKAAYATVVAMKAAPAHHRAEAEEQIREIERQLRGEPPRDPMASRTRPPQLPKPGAVFHVAATGSDANPGTEAKPFATLTRARDAVRSLKRKGSLPPGGVRVVVRGGDYQADATFKLTAEDSGTEAGPVVYRAADGETATFNGGLKLTDFRLVQDPAVLARLPEEARGKVYQTPPLKGPAFTNLGPLKLGGFSSGRGFKTHPIMELFFEGRPMPLARWPNDGFVRVTSVPTNDTHQIHGLRGSRSGRIGFDFDRAQRWQEEKNILLYGYWFWDWADSYEQVAGIDLAKREITLTPPYHTYGYRQGQRFYALNLLSEIDRPGEWYLDHTTAVLYFYPPTDLGKAIASRAGVSLSVVRSPMVELRNVSHVRLEGLTWDMGCADAVMIQGGDHCVLAGCTISRFGGNGIEIRGGTAHGVQSCDIFSLGRGGITVSGGDRRTLTPGGHFIENCRIHDLSRVDHTYTPAILVSGVGNRVAHNLMHDILSSALRVGGNDHVIEYNEVCRVVLESDDQGGVDMHGDPTYRGNVFRYNYWHHIGNWRTPREEPPCGQAGIRFDDAICEQLVYGNVFRRCAAGKLGFGGVQIHGGKENIIDNNLFVDCATAVSFSPWNAAHWRDFTKGKFPSAETEASLYLARYPELARLDENLNVNHLWRNLVVNCGELLRRNRGDARLIDNFQTPESVGFTGRADGDYALATDAALLDQVSFQPIPFAEIGLYRDAWRREIPAADIRKFRTGQ